MLGRELRTKLPELRPNKSVLDEGIRDCDWNHKLASKVYADKQRHAVDSSVVAGDKVLHKNTSQKGKLASNFESKPYTVQTKEGQELTVKSESGTVQRRNSSFVKRYQTQELENPATTETPTNQVVSPTAADSTITTEQRNRPARNVQLPAKFNDFVMYTRLFQNFQNLLREFDFKGCFCLMSLLVYT